MTYSERDLMRVFFKRITACLFDSSERGGRHGPAFTPDQKSCTFTQVLSTEPIMRHRDPLTAARLAELYDQQPSPVALELLWEIHRLRAMIRRVDQIRDILAKTTTAVPQFMWNTFVSELDAEPCLHDPPTPRQQQWNARVLRNVGGEPPAPGAGADR
jgi:hypothetical protein